MLVQYIINNLVHISLVSASTVGAAQARAQDDGGRAPLSRAVPMFRRCVLSSYALACALPNRHRSRCRLPAGMSSIFGALGTRTRDYERVGMQSDVARRDARLCHATHVTELVSRDDDSSRAGSVAQRSAAGSYLLRDEYGFTRLSVALPQSTHGKKQTSKSPRIDFW